MYFTLEICLVCSLKKLKIVRSVYKGECTTLPGPLGILRHLLSNSVINFPKLLLEPGVLFSEECEKYATHLNTGNVCFYRSFN